VGGGWEDPSLPGLVWPEWEAGPANVGESPGMPGLGEEDGISNGPATGAAEPWRVRRAATSSVDRMDTPPPSLGATWVRWHVVPHIAATISIRSSAVLLL